MFGNTWIALQCSDESAGSAASNEVMFPSLSSLSGINHWSAPVRSTDGQTVYVLTFEPDFGGGHRLEALTLTLHYPHEKVRAPNLRISQRDMACIQPCDFVANDLAHGPQKSVFGDKRTLFLKGLGLVVRINVSKAVVSAISTGNYQLCALALRIEVDKLQSLTLKARGVFSDRTHDEQYDVKKRELPLELLQSG
jgi:hypothetical protein